MKCKNNLFNLKLNHFLIPLLVINLLLGCEHKTINQPNENPKVPPKLYVANTESNDLSVIDVTTNVVVKTISVGKRPVDLAFSAKRKELYVANFLLKTVYVIDVEIDSVIETIDLGAFPKSLAKSEEKLYTLVHPDTNVINVFSVFIIDLNNYTIVDTISIPAGCWEYHDILIGPENKLYGAGTLAHLCFVKPETPLIIDLISKEIVRQNSIPANALALSADEEHVYLLDNSIIDVFNIQNLQRETIKGFYGDLCSIIFSTVKQEAYVANSTFKKIMIIHTQSKTVTSEIELDFAPFGVAIAESRQSLYVTHPKENIVSAIDLNTGLISQAISVGSSPRDIMLVSQEL